MSENGKIDINEDWCKGCDICVDVCPRDVLEMKNFVAVVKDLERCTFCQLCELLCPDFAIVLHPPAKKRKTMKE